MSKTNDPLKGITPEVLAAMNAEANRMAARIAELEGLADVLKAEDTSVTLDGNGARLFWSDASEAWETITRKRGNAVTHYNGPDLTAAIEAFKKVAGIE
jgi:hypothetical protein